MKTSFAFNFVLRLLVGLVVLGCAACKPESAATTGAAATQAGGGVPEDGRVPRIVSTVPAATLMLVQMGAEESLVGVTKYDQLFLPANYQDLPVVGDYTSLNYETLIRLKATALVTQTAEHRIEPRLRELAGSQNFRIVNVKLDSIEDLYVTARALGKAAHHENSAERKIEAARAAIAAMELQNKGRVRPRVLYIVGDNPTMIVGDKSFHNEFIQLAGGENLGARVGDGWPVIGNETLLKLNPEVLLVGLPGQPGQTATDPRIGGYMKLPIAAARDHRIYLVTNANSQMLSLDIGEQIGEIQRCLFPEKGVVGGGN